MRRLGHAATGVAFTLAACSHIAPQTVSDPAGALVGTWRLTEFWDRASSTAPLVYRFGQIPCGYIVYTPTGHMSAQIARTPIPPNLPSDSVPGDGRPLDAHEATEMLRRHVSYFGTYRVDMTRSVVTHRVEGDIHRRFAGRDEERPFRLHGDSLILGNDSTWRRVFVREKGTALPNPACAYH